MFKHLLFWFLMTLSLSTLYFLLGFQDIMFLLCATLIYLVMLIINKQHKPQEVLVLAKNCEVCKTPRALTDLELISNKKDFDTGVFEWILRICKDNVTCHTQGMLQIDAILAKEEVRRLNGS